MTSCTCLILTWRLKRYWWLPTQPSNSKPTGKILAPALWFFYQWEMWRLRTSQNNRKLYSRINQVCFCFSACAGMVWAHSPTGCWIALTRLLSLKWMIRDSSSLALLLAPPRCWSLRKRPLVSVKLSSLLWRSVGACKVFVVEKSLSTTSLLYYLCVCLMIYSKWPIWFK